MRLGAISFCVVLGACADVQPEMDSDVFGPGVRLAAVQQGQTVEQPAPYAGLIARAVADEQFRFESLTRQRDLSNTGALQSLYPQVRPGARMDSDGDVAVTLSVEQVLYDGGVYQAELFEIGAQDAVEEIDLLSDLNDQASENIGIYLEFQRNQQISDALRGLIGDLGGLLNLAQTRAAGGIATASEVTLFELKVFEVETEAKVAEAAMALNLQQLNEMQVQVPAGPPPQLRGLPDRLPLEVLAAMADRQARHADVEVLAAQSRPQLVLGGEGALDIEDGETSSDFGLRVRMNSPLQWFGNSRLLAAQEALALSEQTLERTVHDIEQDLSRLSNRISTLQAQLSQTRHLVALSRQRLADFETQFQAGAASLTEAAGLTDTLRRALTSEINLDFELRELQLRRATLDGSLLP